MIEFQFTLNRIPTPQEVESSFSESYLLKSTLQAFLNRDPLDALRDAEVLTGILTQRARTTGMLPPVAPSPLSGEALVEAARQIAERAHAGQFRRDGRTPYIEHPAAVVERLAEELPEVRATAWLHDVLEDTAVTVADLRALGIPSGVLDAVEALTRTDEIYEYYLIVVKARPIARKVKIADMLHNLSDKPTPQQILKYAAGLLVLGKEDF